MDTVLMAIGYGIAISVYCIGFAAVMLALVGTTYSVKKMIINAKLRGWQAEYSGRVSRLLADIKRDHIVRNNYPEVFDVITLIELGTRALDPHNVGWSHVRDMLRDKHPRPDGELDVEAYISNLEYAPGTSDEIKTFVAGNIRGFHAVLKETNRII